MDVGDAMIRRYAYENIVKDEEQTSKRRRKYKKGSLLENNAAWLFSMLGLKVQKNVKIEGHEIDVLVSYGNRKIAVECKQYERSRIVVRNLIYQWNTKKSILKLDKVLIIIWGCEIRRDDFELAKKLGITIWDEQNFEKFFKLAVDKKEAARDEILAAIGLKEMKSESFESFGGEKDPLVEKLSEIVSRQLKTSKFRTLAKLSYFLTIFSFFGIFLSEVLSLLFLLFGTSLLIYSNIKIKYDEEILILALARKLSEVKGTVDLNDLSYITKISKSRIRKKIKKMVRKGEIDGNTVLWNS